jgi:2',3'-cyclic-nucleotide 2'-phosphodiesterase (5'-nucleotidase family)
MTDRHELIFSIAAIALFAFLPNALAQQLEIIHTNDLHSHLEHSEDLTRGSYAAVKATIDRLKAQAAAAGIETLTLDAGDFSEGTPFYMAGDGTDSMRLVQEMGYDAIAIGNHDWLVGADQMNQIFATVKPIVPFLSANLRADARFTALNQYIRPSAEFTRSGLKIAVLGLSTNDILYAWRLQDGKIENPNDVAKEEVKKLRKQNDLVIALTHLGVTADENLVANVNGIDLIVGGHSHTALQVPVWQTSPNKQSVPIVQAGCHGQYVGDLLVDYEPGQPLKILRYQLIPVYTDGDQDRTIASDVKAAREDLDAVYGSQWLSDVLTVTDTPMVSPVNQPTVWGDVYVDALREAVGADLGLDSGEFFGDTQAAGAVTREMMMNFYPRYFDLTKKMGWTVWKIDVPGWLLKAVLEVVTKDGSFFNLSQVEFDIITGSGAPQIKNIRIGGKPLDVLRTYHVAVSEGIGRGLEEPLKALKLIFWPKDSGIPIWTAVENKIRSLDQTEFSRVIANVPRFPAAMKWVPARESAFMLPSALQ